MRSCSAILTQFPSSCQLAKRTQLSWREVAGPPFSRCMIPWQILLHEMQLTQLCSCLYKESIKLVCMRELAFNTECNLMTYPVCIFWDVGCLYLSIDGCVLSRLHGYIRSSLHFFNIFLCMFYFFAGFVFKLLHFVALPPSLSLTLSPTPPYLRVHGAPIAV